MNPSEVETWMENAVDVVEAGSLRGSWAFEPVGLLLQLEGLVTVNDGIATLTDSDQRRYVRRGETRALMLAAQDRDPEVARGRGDNSEGSRWWLTIGWGRTDKDREKVTEVCRKLCDARGWTDSRVVSEHEWTSDGAVMPSIEFEIASDWTGPAMRCAQRACGVQITGEWNESTRQAVRLRRRQYGLTDEAVIDRQFLTAIGWSPLGD